ncbi:MAG: lipoyl synthase [Tissierellia bacterium]|nr:lipoyl synthase [Tissierellia bacterium]
MRRKKPEWIKLKIQGSKTLRSVESVLDNMHLNTVCSEANCPNKMECFEMGTATFMIMGKNCTRNCKFCNVTTRKPMPLDPFEPRNLALAVRELGLRHAVITSVDRDDLEDEGANHFAEVSRLVREYNPKTTVELLIPDFHAREDLLDIVMDTRPNVLNHNIEVVPELFDHICPQSNFEHSMKVLDYAKRVKGLVTKSGMMVGFGETFEMVVNVMKRLREVNCDMLTIGQYLQPSTKHIAVSEYVHPDIFDEYRKIGKELGFKRVDSGPFVRSSYHAQALNDEE